MKYRLYLIMVAFFSLILPITALAGPEGYSEFDWQEIRSIKGGAGTCVISAKGDEGMFPDHKAFFNEQGKLIRFQTGLGFLDFTYNSAGRLTEIKTTYADAEGKYIPGGRTLYAYNAQGKLTSISHRDWEDNEYLSETGITYDASGNLKIERLTSNGNLYKITTYNKDFFVIEDLLYTGSSVVMNKWNKDIESRTVYKYDKNNNLIEKEINLINPPIAGLANKIVQRFEYKFDKQGNKTEQKTTVIPNDERVRAVFMEFIRPVLTFTYSYGPAKLETTDKTLPTKEDKTGAQVQVEWNGQWFPAQIIKQEGEKYLIHYDDYDSSWDEWVTKERIKF